MAEVRRLARDSLVLLVPNSRYLGAPMNLRSGADGGKRRAWDVAKELTMLVYLSSGASLVDVGCLGGGCGLMQTAGPTAQYGRTTLGSCNCESRVIFTYGHGAVRTGNLTLHPWANGSTAIGDQISWLGMHNRRWYR